MKTFRFKDLSTKDFRRLVQALLKEFPREERYRLTDQIERTTQSIILNIAEGSAKRSDLEFARFLEISIASVNEVVAAFDCSLEDGVITVSQYEIIEEKALSLANQIGRFIQVLRKATS